MPTTPAVPGSPFGPCGPGGPESPFGPGGPAGPAPPPTSPFGPGGPAGPVSRFGPGGPAGPAWPCGPGLARIALVALGASRHSMERDDGDARHDLTHGSSLCLLCFMTEMLGPPARGQVRPSSTKALDDRGSRASKGSSKGADMQWLLLNVS